MSCQGVGGTNGDRWLLNDKLRQLHFGLIGGDRSVADEIANVLLPHLLKQFHVRYPTVDRELVFDAVVDELQRYLIDPRQVDGTGNARLYATLSARVRRTIAHGLRGADRRRSRDYQWWTLFSSEIESEDNDGE